MLQTVKEFPEFILKFPQICLPPGVDGQGNVLDASQGQVVFHTIPKGQVVPLHKHKDSWAFLVAGRLKFSLAKEQFIAEAGMAWLIPAEADHGGEAIEHSLLVEVFSEKRFSSE
jgi:quercetin dioxygenase-like cupin family protein